VGGFVCLYFSFNFTAITSTPLSFPLITKASEERVTFIGGGRYRYSPSDSSAGAWGGMGGTTIFAGVLKVPFPYSASCHRLSREE